jgi:hypothetical protein
MTNAWWCLLFNSTAGGNSEFRVFTGKISRSFDSSKNRRAVSQCECATNISVYRRHRLLIAPLLLCFAVSGCSSTQSSASDSVQSGAVTGTVARPGGADPRTGIAAAADGAGVTATTVAGNPNVGASGTMNSRAAASTATSAGGTKPASSSGTANSTTTPTATSTVATIAAAAVAKKSISAWVSCSGTSDDSLGAATAFSAAKNHAFTLVVDCPVFIHSGLDIDRAIFIEDGTTVEFTAAGKFIVDDIFHPAFVIANSNNITLTDWNVEFDGSLPVNENVLGYMQNGQWVVKGGAGQPSNAFNDERLTPWLKTNKNIVFDTSQGPVNSYWAGTTNTCAMFFMVGDSSNVSVTGMHVYAPSTAGGNSFIPVVFSSNLGYKSNQTVTVKTPVTSQYIAVPHNLTFSNTVLDGTYMSWVGTGQNIVIENTQSLRYGDLQDANGGNVGGIGKWFAPPHLFYFNYNSAGDPGLFNTGIQIKNVLDNGPRVGTARDKGGSDTISGNALSLKIGCHSCSVDTYTSLRPDGFLDVLDSNGLTISNVTARYDSAFINNVYPGWRFPKSLYENLTFANISLTDTAAATVQAPIGNASETTNENLTFKNVNVMMVKWSGNDLPLPIIGGTQNKIALEFLMSANATRVTTAEQGAVSVTLQATPAILSAGDKALLTWSSKDASTCSAGGAWSGSLARNGSQTVVAASAGNADFTINCQNGAAASSTTLLANVTAN